MSCGNCVHVAPAASDAPAASVAPPPSTLAIAVPEGVVGGQQIAVEHEGQQLTVVVPDGLKAGDTFNGGNSLDFRPRFTLWLSVCFPPSWVCG